MNKRRDTLLLAGTTVAASILAFGLIANAMQQFSTATADQADILTIDTTPLEGLSLDQGEFLILADTTPAEIESGHVAISVPCTDDSDTPESDIKVVAGVAPDLQPLDMDYVGDLSSPADNRCTFHVTFPQNGEEITDVAIINNGTETVQFESGHFATISLTTAKADDNDDNDDDNNNGNNIDDENDDQNERTFTADLTGDDEVPAVDTDATGDAELTFEEGDDEIEYTVDVQNIVDVTAAHIHMGPEDEDGDIVATLYDDSASGEMDGQLASGTLTASDLEGPLAGESVDDLVQLIEDGDAYVNVHTADNPDGEIRGQLEE